MVKATLTTTVSVCWQDGKGYDRECEVDVTYTFDGSDDLRILESRCSVEPYGIADWDFDEMLWLAVMDGAPEAYADWLADQGDYEREAA